MNFLEKKQSSRAFSVTVSETWNDDDDCCMFVCKHACHSVTTTAVKMLKIGTPSIINSCPKMDKFYMQQCIRKMQME